MRKKKSNHFIDFFYTRGIIDRIINCYVKFVRILHIENICNGGVLPMVDRPWLNMNQSGFADVYPVADRCIATSSTWPWRWNVNYSRKRHLQRQLDDERKRGRHFKRMTVHRLVGEESDLCLSCEVHRIRNVMSKSSIAKWHLSCFPSDQLNAWKTSTCNYRNGLQWHDMDWGPTQWYTATRPGGKTSRSLPSARLHSPIENGLVFRAGFTTRMTTGEGSWCSLLMASAAVKEVALELHKSGKSRSPSRAYILISLINWSNSFTRDFFTSLCPWC